MDREPEMEELQFLGLFGIYKESFKIIFKWRKIFSKITLALILPLTFIFLAQIQVPELIFSKVIHNQESLDSTGSHMRIYNTNSYVNLYYGYSYMHSYQISWEWIAFLSFEAIYIGFFIIFSILTTSAIANSIATIYTAKEQMEFKKVMTIEHKVWNRLMDTFQWSFIIACVYNAVSFFLLYDKIYKVVALVYMVLVIIVINPRITEKTALLIVSLLLDFNWVVVYMSIVWHLASVKYVLEEDFKDIEAMIKSKALIKGKKMVSCAIFANLFIIFVLIQFAFEKMVVHGENFGTWSRVLCGIVCFLLLMHLFLFGMVVQSVFYFVCKSYHHESINKSLLAEDHLEV